MANNGANGTCSVKPPRLGGFETALSGLQKRWIEPDVCCLCGGRALRRVREKGYCKHHYTEAVADATSKVGL